MGYWGSGVYAMIQGKREGWENGRRLGGGRIDVPTVGAANPEDLRGLARGKGREQVGLLRCGGLGPVFVLAEGKVDRVCWGA